MCIIIYLFPSFFIYFFVSIKHYSIVSLFLYLYVRVYLYFFVYIKYCIIVYLYILQFYCFFIYLYKDISIFPHTIFGRYIYPQNQLQDYLYIYIQKYKQKPEKQNFERMVVCSILSDCRRIGGSRYFMPVGQFYAKQFSAGTGLDPRRGGVVVMGQPRACSQGYPITTAPQRPSRSGSLSMPIFLKIFSSCFSCPSWTTEHISQHLVERKGKLSWTGFRSLGSSEAQSTGSPFEQARRLSRRLSLTPYGCQASP